MLHNPARARRRRLRRQARQLQRYVDWTRRVEGAAVRLVASFDQVQAAARETSEALWRAKIACLCDQLGDG